MKNVFVKISVEISQKLRYRVQHNMDTQLWYKVNDHVVNKVTDKIKRVILRETRVQVIGQIIDNIII